MTEYFGRRIGSNWHSGILLLCKIGVKIYLHLED